MALPPINRLTDTFGVAAQIAPDDVPAIAAAGYRSLVNNRPDHEGGTTQPSSDAMATAAALAGLAYAYLPVHPAVQSEQEIDAFAALLAAMPAPVLAFCRSGTRSTRLWNAVRTRDPSGS